MRDKESEIFPPGEPPAAAQPATEIKLTDHVDYYGCVRCQRYHYRGDSAFEAHVMSQDKHGIKHGPKPWQRDDPPMDLVRRSIRTGCDTEDNRRADLELGRLGFVFNASEATWIRKPEPSLQPPASAVQPATERAEEWLKRCMLARGSSPDGERDDQPAIERAVHRILGSCSGRHLVQRFVEFIEFLHPPASAVSPTLEQFKESMALAVAYVNKIIVESDGYPMEHTASDMRTLLVSAFIRGRDSKVSSAVSPREEPKK